MEHRVTLTKCYYIGVFEVTQKQWELIMGSNPSHYKGDTRRPVEKVSYDDICGSNKGSGWPYGNAVDAGSFLERLRAKTGIDFDLPTEAQWEYACRAGTTGELYGNDLYAIAWYYTNSYGTTHFVGQKLPNAWGLYDMLGNVWEWCRDWYGDYPKSDVKDPVGASSGTSRVSRGGSWSDSAGGCLAACRGKGDPATRFRFLGFRLALVTF